MRCLLVDFDGTLTSRDTTFFLVISLLIRRPWLFFFVFYCFFGIYTSRDGLSIQHWKGRCIGRLVSGLSVRDLNRLLVIYRFFVSRYVRDDVLTYLRRVKSSGAVILIVSATFDIAVEFFLRGEGFFVIGNQYLLRDGFFTDRPISPSSFGQGKVFRIDEWVSGFGESLEFVEALSDSISDVPMLSLANRKIWVCDLSVRDSLAGFFPDAVFWCDIN